VNRCRTVIVRLGVSQILDDVWTQLVVGRLQNARTARICQRRALSAPAPLDRGDQVMISPNTRSHALLHLYTTLDPLSEHPA
jgi:hypothetical protein